MIQYIYGKNTVVAAIKNNKSLSKVFLINKDPDILNLLKKNRVAFSLVNKKELNNLVGDTNHQGIVGVVEQFEYATLDQLLNSVKDKENPIFLMLDGLEDPHNLGAILRTADATGVDGIIIPKNRSVSLNSTVAKVSTGAIDHVMVCQVTNLAKTLKHLQTKGYWTVGCDNDQSQDYRKVDYKMPLVLVVGSEGKGISRIVKDNCDFKVVIPMVGHVTSLNVSVATAVLLYQVYNSRQPLEG